MILMQLPSLKKRKVDKGRFYRIVCHVFVTSKYGSHLTKEMYINFANRAMYITEKYMGFTKKFSQHEINEHNKRNLLDLKNPQVVT